MRPSREVRADLHILDLAAHRGFIDPDRAAWLRAKLDDELRAAEGAEAAADERMRRALESAAVRFRRMPEGCGE